MFRLNLVKLRTAFYNHMKRAESHCIGFELTFDQWLKIWLDSGHLAERGNHKGQYGMARFEDKGPYAVGNVKIITTEENLRERKKQVFSDERRAAASRKMLGKQNALGATRSDEWRADLSQRLVGNQYSLGKQNATGHVWIPSDESRANMRKAQKLRRLKEKQLKQFVCNKEEQL